MKQVLKPLGIATAVAAASASFVNVASAQDPVVANNALGDLALVPYYTVSGAWITGIHIVNTSDSTQVVKFRFRRAKDSMDALDFNVVMSPQDVYAGFLSDNADGDIVWSANDTTCTVPQGVLKMPEQFREGAETGYVEIIGMAETTDETQAIARAAKHSSASADPALTPRSCDFVEDNFFADGVLLSTTKPGVISPSQTTAREPSGVQIDTGNTTRDVLDSNYTDSSNALKVSYFIRDNDTGVEFGDNAVHIQNFLSEPAMSNQEFGYLAGDLDGFDFPDLDGASPATGTRGRFNALRDPSVLGVGQLINEWTANPANGAALDWVVTLPGQYLMLHRTGYIAAETNDDITCAKSSAINLFNPQDGATALSTAIAGSTSAVNVACDFRDLPVRATALAYNREEFAGETADRGIVVSPSPPGSVPTLSFEKEVNVVTFGGESVLGVSDIDVTADLGQPFGWLALSVTPSTTNTGICEFNTGINKGDGTAGALTLDETMTLFTCPAPSGSPGTETTNLTPVTGNVPMIGFAAWQRSVAANPDASYGRIIGHSFTVSN